ncbi:putative protein phosphatase 2C 67-like [Trifolium medium]|uniref:Uncharacterized protein n=1 Tax=Trifolium medium TaxID=97028 RepID=A0A392MD38_9FABA|nr:putative protein phosphatase 2C 67-like [Trifolium medium]
MNEFAETHKREADSENKEEIAASKKLRVESSEENDSKEVSFLIEADAAEDKGLRHSMEDEWVVLLDAARDYPGNLSTDTDTGHDTDSDTDTSTPIII